MKNVGIIILILLSLYVAISFGWGLLNTQECLSDLPKNPTCKQIAENKSKNCKYVFLKWKKVDYNLELKQCKEWELKNQTK